jgi:hypothetical protein
LLNNMVPKIGIQLLKNSKEDQVDLKKKKLELCNINFGLFIYLFIYKLFV